MNSTWPEEESKMTEKKSGKSDKSEKKHVYDRLYDEKIVPLINEKIPKTASEWELYSTAEGAEEGAKEIAETMREGLRDIARAYLETMKKMEAVLRKHRKLGAEDTEPYWHYRDCMRKLFEMLREVTL